MDATEPDGVRKPPYASSLNSSIECRQQYADEFTCRSGYVVREASKRPLLRNGASVPETKELARHTDVLMTMRYAPIGIHDQTKAVAKLPPSESWLHFGTR